MIGASIYFGALTAFDAEAAIFDLKPADLWRDRRQ